MRNRQRLTQAELSVRAGVPLDTVRSVEQGRTKNPGVFTVKAIADALGTSVDRLLRDRTS